MKVTYMCISTYQDASQNREISEEPNASLPLVISVNLIH